MWYVAPQHSFLPREKKMSSPNPPPGFSYVRVSAQQLADMDPNEIYGGNTIQYVNVTPGDYTRIVAVHSPWLSAYYNSTHCHKDLDLHLVCGALGMSTGTGTDVDANVWWEYASTNIDEDPLSLRKRDFFVWCEDDQGRIYSELGAPLLETIREVRGAKIPNTHQSLNGRTYTECRDMGFHFRAFAPELYEPALHRIENRDRQNTLAQIARIERGHANQICLVLQSKCFQCGDNHALKFCACRSARYCNRECQKKNWPVHKLVCSLINQK